MENTTVTKYVQSINIMSNVTGLLEAVRLNCHANNDKASIYLIEKAIKEINKCLGTETHLIDLSQFDNNQSKIQIVEQTPIVHVAKTENQQQIDSGYLSQPKHDIAKAVLKSEKSKKIDEYGVITNEEENTQEYTFKNSSSLAKMKYFKDTKELMMTFLKNGRTYLYKKVDKNVFETLYLLDNNGGSAGRHFQKNIVSVWKKGQYEEIETLLG